MTQMEAGEWFARWMIERCPVKIPQAQFHRVVKKFLDGHLVVVYSRPVTLDLGKVEIWVE